MIKTFTAWGGQRIRDYGSPPFAVGTSRVALCDGTGDWGEGAFASRVGVHRLIEDGDMQTRFARADEAVKAFTADIFGSACSGIAISIEAGKADIGWVGGLEAWLLRDRTIAERTRPHLLGPELLATGKLPPELYESFELKDVITRALGGHGGVLEETCWALRAGDLILLASRNVFSTFTEPELIDLALKGPQAIVDRATSHHEVCAITVHVDR